ncbi:phosphoadenosine phosphosulfate reductase family protein [Vibrio parahaemolyticus]|nr:phosphoadenosine phosphosulfate reductase family protein [Vibrio parahaemolyticus]
MYNVINTIDPEKLKEFNRRLDEAEAVIDKHLGKEWDFKIPNTNPSFFGMSGGVDSSVLTGIMFIKNREHLLKYGATLLFCDTGDEPQKALELLDFIEEFLGVEIVRIQDETLFGVLEKHGNYLPSAKSRWCTQRLKTDPYNAYLQKYVLEDGGRVNTFVGINASESDRAQDLGIEGIDAFFPFVTCGVTRKQITSIGVELSLMNRSYADGRSRSGCMHCFFMSKPEVVSMYIENRAEFLKGQAVEVLPEGVEERIMSNMNGALPSLGRYTIWPTCDSIKKGKEHFQFPGTTGETENMVNENSIHWDWMNKERIPSKKKPKKARKRCDKTFDLFETPEEELMPEEDSNEELNTEAVSYDERVLYVAVEHWYYDGMGLCFSDKAAGIPARSKLIVFSTSQSGLVNSLSGWWYHRLAAAKLNFDSEEDYGYRTHVAVYAIRFDEGIIPVMGKHDGYTWFPTYSYSSLGKTIDAIELAAHTHSSHHIVKNKRGHSWIEIESAEKYANATKDNPIKFGEFIGVGHYRPKSTADFEDSLDNNVKNVRCVTCSI